MKIVTIRCEHSINDLHLHMSENKMWCIQCGLIQILLSPAQAARVRRHCHCMQPQLKYERQNNQGQVYMTIDPSQIDLKGQFLSAWLIG